MNFSIIKILFIDYEIDKLWHFQAFFYIQSSIK